MINFANEIISVPLKFVFQKSPEPTYVRIYEGEWLDDEDSYHVVHRIGSVAKY